MLIHLAKDMTTDKPKWKTLFDEARSLIDDWEEQILNDPKLKPLSDDQKHQIVETLFSTFLEDLKDSVSSEGNQDV